MTAKKVPPHVEAHAGVAEGFGTAHGASAARDRARVEGDVVVTVHEPASDPELPIRLPGKEPPPEARGLRERQIREATAAVRARKDGHPTREDVAAELGTTEPTLKRAMKDLGMKGWPPAPPED